jgi:hypothetical protein
LFQADDAGTSALRVHFARSDGSDARFRDRVDDPFLQSEHPSGEREQPVRQASFLSQGGVPKFCWIVGYGNGGHTLIRSGSVVFEGNRIISVGPTDEEEDEERNDQPPAVREPEPDE